MRKMTTEIPQRFISEIYRVDLRLRAQDLRSSSKFDNFSSQFVVSSSLVPRLLEVIQISAPFVLRFKIGGFLSTQKFRVFARISVYPIYLCTRLCEFPNFADLRKSGGCVEIFNMLFSIISGRSTMQEGKNWIFLPFFTKKLNLTYSENMTFTKKWNFGQKKRKVNIPGVKNEGNLIFLAGNVKTNGPKRLFQAKIGKKLFSQTIMCINYETISNFDK